MVMVENQTGATMRLIGNLIERLSPLDCAVQNGMDYAKAREWNGQMIGDLGRRSSDA
jgi:hypothetical protein